MNVAFTMTPVSINLLLDNRMRIIERTHMNFGDVRAELKKAAPDMTKLRELVDIPSFIAKVTQGRVEVGDGEVRFDGDTVHGVISDRLCAMLSQGFDVKPLAKFLENLMANPLQSAKDELYLWLEESEMPITPDGHFLAFKKVDDDYTSFHKAPDGSAVRNDIGTTVSMPREDVCADRARTCSKGLHFCAFSYLASYYGSSGRVVIVKVNPADVVAIPNDYNNAKGRAWRYDVVGEVPQEECGEAFTAPVMTGFGDYDFSCDDDDNYVEDELDVDVDIDEDADDPTAVEYATMDVGIEKVAEPVPTLKTRTAGEVPLDTLEESVKTDGWRPTARKFSIPRTTLRDAIKRWRKAS